jgi:hypothetical protein
MQTNCCTEQAALLNLNTLTWTPTGSGKFDVNDEEGWTLLPNKNVLTVDAYVFAYDSNGTTSEIYNSATASWSSAGSTIVQVWDSAARCGGRNHASFEVGPGSPAARRDRLLHWSEPLRRRAHCKLFANQKAINGSVNMIRTGTLSIWAGNCGLAGLVLST